MIIRDKITAKNKIIQSHHIYRIIVKKWRNEDGESELLLDCDYKNNHYHLLDKVTYYSMEEPYILTYFTNDINKFNEVRQNIVKYIYNGYENDKKRLFDNFNKMNETIENLYDDPEIKKYKRTKKLERILK